MQFEQICALPLPPSFTRDLYKDRLHQTLEGQTAYIDSTHYGMSAPSFSQVNTVLTADPIQQQDVAKHHTCTALRSHRAGRLRCSNEESVPLLAVVQSRGIVAFVLLQASVPIASGLLRRSSFLRAAMPENAATGVLTPMNVNPTSTSSPSKKAKLSTAAVSPAPISTLRVKRLAPDATLPQRGSAKAAGYDLAR